jgi:hypothetical protein
MTPDKEIWKRIPGFPGYEASNHGRVRTYYIRGRTFDYSRIPKLIRPTLWNGYRYFKLCSDRKRITKSAANLVLLAFIGPKPNNMEACHNDGNKLNDHLSNLRYDTRQNNILDIPEEKRSRMVMVDRKHLKDRIVITIMERLSKGECAAELAKEYGVSEATVSRWKNGTRRSHLLEQVAP